jgi:tRNA threonylcarbamoyladenosine biosynthesis protein TsaB
MNILAIDTAGSSCSVMLSQAGKECFRSESAAQRHSRHILALIEQVLLEARLSLEQIDLLAWNAGPGSFTGLRIGASVVQALSYSHQLPILALSSLELLAHLSVRQGSELQIEPLNLAVAVNAQMSGIYWATFTWEKGRLKRQEEDQLLAKDQIEEKKKAIGSSCIRIGDAWQEAGCYEDLTTSAADVMITSRQIDRGRWLTNPADCLPNYIHNTINWQKRQLKRPV